LTFGQITYHPKTADKCVSDNFGLNYWFLWHKKTMLQTNILRLAVLISIRKFRPEPFYKIDPSQASVETQAAEYPTGPKNPAGNAAT
jgi:hypothetical protein